VFITGLLSRNPHSEIETIEGVIEGIIGEIIFPVLVFTGAVPQVPS